MGGGYLDFRFLHRGGKLGGSREWGHRILEKKTLGVKIKGRSSKKKRHWHGSPSGIVKTPPRKGGFVLHKMKKTG